jgi:hypothetical protein
MYNPTTICKVANTQVLKRKSILSFREYVVVFSSVINKFKVLGLITHVDEILIDMSPNAPQGIKVIFIWYIAKKLTRFLSSTHWDKKYVNSQA